MKVRTYIVRGETKDTKDYTEVSVQAVSAKQAYEIASNEHPQVRFISARKQGCSCGA